MAKELICGGKKYQIGGPKEDSIGLPVSIVGLPDKIKVEGRVLLLKTSFHISLVCVGKIIERYNISISDFLNKVAANFCEFINENGAINFLRYRDEFRFAEDDKRKSVIVMCDISNLNNFFEFINKKYNLAIEYPPAHITLYTSEKDKGIFLTDSDEIKRLTKIIPDPIGVDFKIK